MSQSVLWYFWLLSSRSQWRFKSSESVTQREVSCRTRHQNLFHLVYVFQVSISISRVMISTLSSAHLQLASKLSALRRFELIWGDWDKCAYQCNNNNLIYILFQVSLQLWQLTDGWEWSCCVLCGLVHTLTPQAWKHVKVQSMYMDHWHTNWRSYTGSGYHFFYAVVCHWKFDSN